MNPLEARRRLLGRNVYKRTTEGNPAIATDSLARRYPGIEMQGWTEQDSTTGAQLWDEANEAGYVGGRRYVFHCEPNTDYTFSTDVTVSSLGVLYVGFNNENVLAVKYNATELTFNSGEYDTLYMQVYSPENFGDIKVMLNAGSTVLPYEPYTGGKPSPSPDYPQEIVSAGNWNEEAQKWEYEITITNAQTDPDKNQTVTLTADRPLTKWDKLEKRNGQWGWVYKSNEAVFDGSDVGEWTLYNNGFYISEGLKDITLDKTLHAGSLSDKFRYSGSGDYARFRVTGSGSSYSPIFYYSGIVDVESWKKFLAENNVSYLYPTEAETFVPLSAEEQEAMNALYTFRPTTVLSNQQDCQMTLTYKTRKGMS